MIKIADAARPALPSNRLRTKLLTLALTAFVAACAPQGGGTNGDVMKTVRKESCEITTVVDGRGDVRIIKNWVLHNDTIQVPASDLSDYREKIDQERKSCVSS